MRLLEIRHPLTDPARVAVVAGWIGRIVAALAQFVAIRILTQMLGVDGYGAYAIITGLLAWFLLADLGMGSSLQNHISSQRVVGKEAYDAISSTSLFLTGTTAILAAVLALASPWVGPFLLSAFPIPEVDAQLAFFAFGSITGATAAANIVLKIFFAYHRGYLSHAITTGAAILGVAALAIVNQLDLSHSLVWAIIAFYLPGWMLPAIAITLHLVHMRARTALSLRIHPPILTSFWSSARWFVLFAALGALTLNLDYVILSRTVSAQEIAVYSVFARVYTLVIALLGSVMSAYWPVSSELIQKQDFDGLTRLIRRALLIGGSITLVVSTGIYFFLDLIGSLLSPDAPLVLPTAFVPFFTIYCLLRVWTDTYSMVITSAGHAWVQCLIVPWQAVFSLGLGYWLALQHGALGVVLGIIASYLLTVVWALPLYVRFGIVKDRRRVRVD